MINKIQIAITKKSYNFSSTFLCVFFDNCSGKGTFFLWFVEQSSKHPRTKVEQDQNRPKIHFLYMCDEQRVCEELEIAQSSCCIKSRWTNVDKTGQKWTNSDIKMCFCKSYLILC